MTSADEAIGSWDTEARPFISNQAHGMKEPIPLTIARSVRQPISNVPM
jgi:hypothetical protein